MATGEERSSVFAEDDAEIVNLRAARMQLAEEKKNWELLKKAHKLLVNESRKKLNDIALQQLKENAKKDAA